MFKWLLLFLAFVFMLGCLGAMGVGAKAMEKLLLALGAMLGVALLIAWPLLRKAGR